MLAEQKRVFATAPKAKLFAAFFFSVPSTIFPIVFSPTSSATSFTACLEQVFKAMSLKAYLGYYPTAVVQRGVHTPVSVTLDFLTMP